MINLKDVYKIQSEYGVADESFKDSEISFEDYLAQCRVFISKNLPDDYTKGNWDTEKKMNTLINLTSLFVDKHKVNVKGYTSSEGIPDTELLLSDLCDSVTGEAIVKEALADPEIDEIQINDKNTIFVIRNGIPEYYTDSKGRVMQFSNNDEIHTLLNKLIDDGTGNLPQFTDGVPLLNAKTAKHQYRINAVHHVANTMDKPPYNYPITTVVIRKFKESNLSIEDLVRGGACTEQMGRLLMLLGRAELKLFCVGPTGSGKTTLLRIIASTVPKTKRMILIQNPTEISFFEKDAYGRNTRNVVHWEVVQSADDSKNTSATMANLISNSLRATPEVILIGEAREPEEFEQIQRAMRTGHKTLGTFHAEDARDAIGRFASEISKGNSYLESVRMVADSIDIIISQFKFENGERKVMEISEILGTDDNGDPIVHTLFKYNFTGRMATDEKGRVKVLGEFRQENYMSEKLKNALYKVGIPFETIEEFCDPKDKEKESKGV